MRSRFWLGDVDPVEVIGTPEQRIAMFPDRLGAGLLKHCQEEMGYLAEFLPSLYAAESGGRRHGAESDFPAATLKARP